MLVTLITVCHNRRDTIGEAILSVLSQDYPDIEYLILDGASTDGTASYVRSLLARETAEGATPLIRRHAAAATLVSEPDHGMYEALNKGMRRATGHVIGLVHSDDVLIGADVVSRYVECFRRSTADMVYADGIYVDAHDTRVVRRLWVSGRYARWKVKLGWLPLHPTVFVRREALRPDVLYDEQYRVAADTKFLYYYLHEQPLRVSYLPQYTVRMRMGGLSTAARWRILVYHEDVSIYRDYGLHHPHLAKALKMMWKVPQYVNAMIRRRFP